MKDEVKLLIFSGIVLLAAYGVSFIFPIPVIILLLLTFYFGGFAYVFNQRLQKAFADENKNKFTQVFMGLTGIKILTSLVLLVCFLYFFTENRFNIGICTMAYYMAYTIFEVVLWKGKLK